MEAVTWEQAITPIEASAQCTVSSSSHQVQVLPYPALEQY